MRKFVPHAVYYEEDAKNYELGKELIKKYENQGIPTHIIENHNNIEEMRKKDG